MIAAKDASIYWHAFEHCAKKNLTDLSDKYKIKRFEKKAKWSSIEETVREITDKQIQMETENKWNLLSPEDSMIMALAGFIENTKPSAGNKSKKKPQGDKQDSKKSHESNKSKSKYKEDWFPVWKKTPPAKGEKTTKIVENCTYHWCTKCRAGKELWVMHKEHDDNFLSLSQQQSNKVDSTLNTNESTTKVTLNTVPTTTNDDVDSTENS